jgi:hypothetical protein
MEQSLSWDANNYSPVQEISSFMEPEGLSACSQQRATATQPKPD